MLYTLPVKYKMMLRTVAALFLLAPASVWVARAQTPGETVLHVFNGPRDGIYPASGVFMDGSGNLFGTTSYGGVYNNGFVYKLSPPAAGQTAWTETALYSFPTAHGGIRGSLPESPLLLNASGEVFGTTLLGGGAGDGFSPGDGTLFKLTPPGDGVSPWTENVLYSFASVDGSFNQSGPLGTLLVDGSGNVFGVTETLGTSKCGTVFEIVKGSATVETLYNFTCGADGGYPAAGLISDATGNLYGSTFKYGSGGNGVVFELSPTIGGSWTETPIYSFTGGADGAAPEAKLIFDASGNLYGTAYSGGSLGAGVVFELTPPASGSVWAETVIHTFTEGADGALPHSALISDGGHGFYGTASGGGVGLHKGGVVFHLQPPVSAGGAWTLMTLHQFQGGPDGYIPLGDLIRVNGVLYGVTQGLGTDGSSPGTVYQVVP